MITFTQFLIEALSFDPAKVLNQFRADFARDNPEGQAPTPAKLVSMLNRQAYRQGANPVQDYVVQWFGKKGFLDQRGNSIAPTQKGSQFRGSIANTVRNGVDISSAADSGYKALRKYFMDVTDAATKEWLQQQDEGTLEAIAIARELSQDDIAILNGIRDRAANHRERGSFVQAMREKNPERLNRLTQLGFLDDKAQFNKAAWDKFVGVIKGLDPARIKTVVPDFYKWSTHSAGNTARNINSVLFAIHPDSRNRSQKGRVVWDMLKNLDNNTFTLLKNGKKPRQGELSEEAYNLLTTAVASIVRSFPNAQDADQLMNELDSAFNSRVDFKSLDRSGDKTRARRQGVSDLLQQR